VRIIKLTPNVRPARSLLDAALLIHAVESGVAAGLQRAAKVTQVPFRMLAFAVR